MGLRWTSGACAGAPRCCVDVAASSASVSAEESTVLTLTTLPGARPLAHQVGEQLDVVSGRARAGGCDRGAGSGTCFVVRRVLLAARGRSCPSPAGPSSHSSRYSPRVRTGAPAQLPVLVLDLEVAQPALGVDLGAVEALGVAWVRARRRRRSRARRAAPRRPARGGPSHGDIMLPMAAR